MVALGGDTSQGFDASKPTAYIGVYLQRLETKETHCASDRIRGEWVVNNCDQMEFFNPSQNYEVVIFHLPCKAIATHGRIKILDICDRVWEKNLGEFKSLIGPIDAIIVPTERLKTELACVTHKPIHVIPDGHDFSAHNGKTPNPHDKPAGEAVWFGYAENAKPLEPLIDHIKSLGLKLKVICQHQQTAPLQRADVFVKWDASTYVQEISKSDFAILPHNQDYKSNNKEITALLCGIPVAKTASDISRFMIPSNRKLELIQRSSEIAKHDVRFRVADYLRVIDEIKKVDTIKVYSAICGGFDRPRNDIAVFGDTASDQFKMPVMNAKIYKMLPHKYFSSNITIYVDGNVFLNVPPSRLSEQLLKDADMALFPHPYRKCLYEEYEHARKRVPVMYRGLMDDQVRAYRRDGMPASFGLGECGMLIRRHNKATEEFNERWWAEVCRYTNRDQMSFPYVLWKMKDRIKVNFIEGNVRRHAFFRYVEHFK